MLDAFIWSVCHRWSFLVQCTQQLMTELDSLLQLAAVFSGQSSDLHLVRSAFVDSVKVNLGSLAAKMTDVSLGVFIILRFFLRGFDPVQF